jgi:hypothetical protein
VGQCYRSLASPGCNLGPRQSRIRAAAEQSPSNPECANLVRAFGRKSLSAQCRTFALHVGSDLAYRREQLTDAWVATISDAPYQFWNEYRGIRSDDHFSISSAVELGGKHEGLMPQALVRSEVRLRTTGLKYRHNNHDDAIVNFIR